MLNLVSRSADIHFHPKCSLCITHLDFADDVLILSQGDLSSMEILSQQLSMFGKISGLDLNPSKSSIYFERVKDSVKISLLQLTGFREGTFLFTYLGVLLSPRQLLVSQFSPLIHKLESTIQGWMGKFLTYIGRLELVRFVSFGQVFFYPRSSYFLYQQYLQKFSVVRVISKKSALVAQKTVNLPKSEGALGLLDLKARSEIILAKHLWIFH